jgi:hypothetical protein
MGQTFMDLSEEDFNKMAADSGAEITDEYHQLIEKAKSITNKMAANMRGAEMFEFIIRQHYGAEIADEYHQLFEKAKEITNELPTADDLDNLFNCADDEREITFNNDESTVIVDGKKYKIDANGRSKIVDDESE